MRDDIQRVRRFNRFYTEQIGVVSERVLESAYTLAEGRVLYEIARGERPTAAAIAEALGVDRGYLSRILRRFHTQRLVRRRPSPRDGREALLSLTPRGRAAFRSLDTRTNAQVGALLERVPRAERGALLAAMGTIEQVIGRVAGRPVARSSARLRPPRSGELGWMVHRHGALYAAEYGYDERFEALVARIVVEFVERQDVRRERCWIADCDGAVAGSVMLVRLSELVAKLRLLYVEPWARGQGIGERLVSACVRFARQAGYRKIVLWTQSELLAARRLYAKAGFVCVNAEPHQSFSRDDLVAETWELELDQPVARHARTPRAGRQRQVRGG
ncbi:MAG TPA: bifunctional helix-turn-helix transcriptional regulator/GNAT family N-acetyltransferase [Gemmatimonadaceae bacterium]|nr:bifunctional helix-turn-helix transcriptional regulator/GNAT family N-acetyltransferase [Gemmatimonadaceae bacterium]